MKFKWWKLYSYKLHPRDYVKEPDLSKWKIEELIKVIDEYEDKPFGLLVAVLCEIKKREKQ